MENEQYKSKLIRAKNEEMNIIRRLISQKTKELYKYEKINEKKNEILEQNENEINQLKEELRNKSLEIKILRNSIEINNNSNNNLNNLTKNKRYTDDNSSKKNSKKNLYGLNLATSFNNNPNRPTTDLLNFAKGIFKQIEDELVKKNKLKKKLKLMKKEKNDFLGVLKKHEERLKTKIDCLAKAKTNFEQILKSIDDDNK